MAKGKGFAMWTDQGPCPCGGGSYQSCCAPLHRGEKQAETAEQLMRSRDSAFVKGELDYLMATHREPDVHPSQRCRALRQSCRQTRWLGLTVIGLTDGGAEDVEGIVQFEARYRGGILKETSLFKRRDGSAKGDWLYEGALKLGD